MNPPGADSGRTLVFVSHVHEDRAVAAWLRTRLEEHFLGMVRVFVSSDTEGIGAGEKWFEVMDQRLNECRLLLILCTPESIYQPWVNFEAGAAWALRKRMVPVCHGGLTPDDLRMPFLTWQGLTLTLPEDLEKLYRAVAKQHESNVPAVAFDQLVTEIPRSEPGGDAAGGHDSPDRLRLRAERATRERLHAALSDKEPWRTPARVASEAGVSEEVAMTMLRADRDVQFGSTRDGSRPLVGLKERVNPG